MSYVKHANIKNLIFAVLLISILGYTYFQMRNLVTGPIIVITEPKSGAVLTSPRVSIIGTTKNISSIELNNRQIFINEQGSFAEKTLLSPGYNVVTLEAKDRFGRETKNVLELVYN